MVGYTWLRWRPGQVVLHCDRSLGKWAARELQRRRPQACYLFTQIALETLQWCRREGIPTVLDNPNGHIRNFREVCENEWERWLGKRFFGNPTSEMVERVEEEYRLADRIRVHSEWARDSMLRRGVPENKIHLLRQTVNLERFHPPSRPAPQDGPLRVCYVGSLDLRKGFPYLLQAVRAVGANRVQLHIVGATGDRTCAQLFARERVGLQVESAPGDPLPVYQRSEVFVLPTLEDGLGLVALEAQACGLPVILTEEAGARECVRPGQTGWIVPAANVEALAAALRDALDRRAELSEMGRQARADVELYAGPEQLGQLSDWFYCRARAGLHS
jgi:glycosyltransferase involved in cell wall biosynthesis